jgi:hypothetical protein
MTRSKPSRKSSFSHPPDTEGDFDTPKRAQDENAKSIPPEDRKQKGAPFGQPVAGHEPPTYGNKGTSDGSVAANQTAGKRNPNVND